MSGRPTGSDEAGHGTSSNASKWDQKLAERDAQSKIDSARASEHGFKTGSEEAGQTTTWREAARKQKAEKEAENKARAAEPKKPSLFSRLGAALGDATKAITNAVLGGTPEEREEKKTSQKTKDALRVQRFNDNSTPPLSSSHEDHDKRKTSVEAKNANDQKRNDRLIDAENNKGYTEPGQGQRSSAATKLVESVRDPKGARPPTPPPSSKGTGRNRSSSSQSVGSSGRE